MCIPVTLLTVLSWSNVISEKPEITKGRDYFYIRYQQQPLSGFMNKYDCFHSKSGCLYIKQKKYIFYCKNFLLKQNFL